MASRTVIRIESGPTVVRLDSGPTIVRTEPAYTVIRTSGIAGPPGPAGPAGPQGPPGAGSSGNLTYPVAVPATTWTVPHTLGFFPNVTTIDSAGDEIEGTVTYPDILTVTIVFNSAVSGVVYLS